METHSKMLKMVLLSILSVICLAAAYAQPGDENTEAVSMRYGRVIQNHVTDSRVSAADELSAIILTDGISASIELFGVMQSHPDSYIISQKQLMALAERLINENHLTEAIVIFQLTAHAFPNEWAISEKMGTTYLLMGNRIAAESCFDKASDIKARNELKDTVFSKIQL